MPPPEITFVIDVDAGPNVADGIREAGGLAVLTTSYVTPDTPDVEWLPRVSSWGHALITRDVSMRTVPEERALLDAIGVHVFIIRGNNMRRDELRDLARQHCAAMLRLISKEALPYLAHITRTGIEHKTRTGRRAAIKKD